MNLKSGLWKFLVYSFRAGVVVAGVVAVLGGVATAIRSGPLEGVGTAIAVGWLTAVYAGWYFRDRWVPRVRSGVANLAG